MSKAIVGQGATISIEKLDSGGASTYITISEVNNVSGIGSGSATVIDVTHLKSTGKEKKLGLKDEGQIKLNMNFLDGDEGQELLKTARNNQSIVKLKFELKNKKTKTGKGTTWELSGYVVNFEVGGIGVDEKLTVDCSIEITGSVTEKGAS